MENKDKTKKWLDNLQQESWQLEMIFSGLSIALLNEASEPITRIIEQSLFRYQRFDQRPGYTNGKERKTFFTR